MNQLITTPQDSASGLLSLPEHESFITLYVGSQIFGLPILTVRDVLIAKDIYRIPLVPKEIAGTINLRGRIVTVIDLRILLGLKPQKTGKKYCVIVEQDKIPYGLLIDKIGDVMELPRSQYEDRPAPFDHKWTEYSNGVYRIEKQILVVLNTEQLLTFKPTQTLLS